MSSTRELPPELWIMVFNKLPIKDLTRLNFVSKKFSIWAHDSSLAYVNEMNKILNKFLDFYLERFIRNKNRHSPYNEGTESVDDYLDRTERVDDYFDSKRDYEAQLISATKHDCVNQLKIWEAAFLTGFKCILCLPKNTLNRVNIDFLIKVSVYTKGVELENNEIASFNSTFKTNCKTTTECHSLAKSIISIIYSLFSITENGFSDLLLECHADLPLISLSRIDNGSLLHIAIHGRNYEKAIRLIQLGADVNLSCAIVPEILNGSYRSVEYSHASPLFDSMTNMMGIIDTNESDRLLTFIKFIIQSGANPEHPCNNIFSDVMDDTPLAWAHELNDRIANEDMSDVKPSQIIKFKALKETCDYVIDASQSIQRNNGARI